MGAVGDFFIAIGKDKEKYIWMGRSTADNGRQTTDYEARSFDDELKIADSLLRDYFTTTGL